MSDIFQLECGDAPLLVSLPHDGSAIPEEMAARMTPAARRSPDTDWHVGRLYACARELGASIIRPHWSRYVIDLNRPDDGHALYPGRKETGLVSTVMFDGEPIYAADMEPDALEVRLRVEGFWRPYHTALAAELERIRDKHGRAVLWEGHSIRGAVPMLFDGRLPDFNLGTASGTSCRPGLREALATVLAATPDYSHVVDGRFKGGYITRHYGDPARAIDAVQLELVQSTYMDEASFAFDADRATPVIAIIRRLLETAIAG